jgi:predicted P-loop ATPase
LAGNDEKIRAAIDAAARTNGYHPFVEYLIGCKWDGVTRVRTFFRTYLGVKGDNDLDAAPNGG